MNVSETNKLMRIHSDISFSPSLVLLDQTVKMFFMTREDVLIQLQVMQM